MEKEKFYLTTAIAYTSGKPHIGNTYEVVLADALCRFKRKQGYDVFFQTGTDDHGQKIEEKAKLNNLEPKEFTDKIAREIKNIFDLMDTSYDNFIRTTDSYHEKQVQKIFKKLYEQKDIYKSEYEGHYCKACESFITQSQLKDGCCPDCGAKATKAKEEAYFFRMSKYADRLLKHIEENPQFIQPESRKNEMINNFIKPGLQDLCVSRTSFTWGINVDFDPKHVIYVWIDALSNYITGLGYDVDGNHKENFKKYWPAQIHLIGKDILRFHTIYWPIILMALDLPLPKQIFGHPWLLSGESKMSKSKGNVIYADDLVNIFGVDAVRYFLLHEMPFAQDGTITYELMIERINTSLANVLGNLLNRTVVMANKYFDGKISNNEKNNQLDEEVIDFILNAKEKIKKLMDNLKVSDSIDEIFKIFNRLNKYIDETCPWILAKEEKTKNRLEKVLYILLEGIRVGAILLESFLPKTSQQMLEQIGANDNTFESLKEFGKQETFVCIKEPKILFKRLDPKEILESLENKENNTDQDKHKENIKIDDFDKVEMIVGEVLECIKHPKADRLLVLKVKISENEIRQIVSGIANYYQENELIGKKILICANLKPIKLKGIESFGMILTIEKEQKIKVIETDMPVGSVVK